MNYRYLGAIAVGVVAISGALFYSYIINDYHSDRTAIAIVKEGKHTYKNSISPNKEAVGYSPITGWKVSPSSADNWKDEIIPSFVKLYIKRLRWVIDFGGKDEAWANSAKSRLQILVSQIGHTKGVPTINCGQRICEVHVETVSGLSDDEKRGIIDKLAEPAYGQDEKRFFTVRQIFTSTDIGESQDGFFAYYQKRPT